MLTLSQNEAEVLRTVMGCFVSGNDKVAYDFYNVLPCAIKDENWRNEHVSFLIRGTDIGKVKLFDAHTVSIPHHCSTIHIME